MCDCCRLSQTVMYLIFRLIHSIKHCHQGRIQPVSLNGAISITFVGQVSVRVHYCKSDEVYFTTLLWQNYGRQNVLVSWILFSELFKIMVKKVTFIGSPHPWIRPDCHQTFFHEVQKSVDNFMSLTLSTSKIKLYEIRTLYCHWRHSRGGKLWREQLLITFRSNIFLRVSAQK